MYISIDKKYINADLDASGYVISGNEPLSEMLQAKVKNRNEPKQAMPKCQDRSRSLETN